MNKKAANEAFKTAFGLRCDKDVPKDKDKDSKKKKKPIDKQ